MSVPSQLLRAQPLVAPAGWLAVGLLAVVAGAGSAFVATQFENGAPLVLLALFVAPLLALGIIVNPLIAILVVIAAFPIGSVAQSIGPLRIQAVEVAVFVAALVVVLRRLAIGRIPLPFAAPLGWAVALFLWTLVSLFSAIDETLAIRSSSRCSAASSARRSFSPGAVTCATCASCSGGSSAPES